MVNETIKISNAVAGTYYIQVYSKAHAYNSSSCYTLNATVSSVALREADDSENDSEVTNEPALNLYPNPSTGEVYLDMNVVEPLDFVDIQVYDILGKQIRAYTYPDVTGYLKANIDLKGLPNGVYNVLISSTVGIESRKVILQR